MGVVMVSPWTYEQPVRLRALITHHSTFAHQHDTIWARKRSVMARKCVFDLFTWNISFSRKSFVQHYSPRFGRHTSWQSPPVLEMLQNILILADFFANWRLLVRLFIRGAAAKHPLFGGETYQFLGSNAALWPEKSSLGNEITHPAIKTPHPGSNFCCHNEPAVTWTLLIAGDGFIVFKLLKPAPFGRIGVMSMISLGPSRALEAGCYLQDG